MWLIKKREIPEKQKEYNSFITEVYELARPVFFKYMMSYSKNFQQGKRITKEDVEDWYNDSFLVMYHNIQSGKLTEFTANPTTYLIEIGKNIARNFSRKNRDISVLENIAEPLDANVADVLEKERQEVMAREIVNMMNTSCTQLLKLYYWAELSMEEIAKQMNFSGSDSAKSQKSKCFGKFKKLLISKLREEELL